MPPSYLSLQRTIARARSLFYVARPFATPLVFLLLLRRFPALNRPSAALLLLLAYVYMLRHDHVLHANLLNLLGDAQPGVYSHDKLLVSVPPRLVSLIHNYRPPFPYRFGDISTISFLRYAPPAEFRREILFMDPASPDSKFIELDFFVGSTPAVAATAAAPRNVVLMLCGIGGDSRSPYIRCLCNRLCVERGLEVCVLPARGIGNSTPVTDLSHLFDPTSPREGLRALQHLSGKYENVMVMGFSLGAVVGGSPPRRLALTFGPPTPARKHTDHVRGHVPARTPAASQGRVRRVGRAGRGGVHPHGGCLSFSWPAGAHYRGSRTGTCPTTSPLGWCRSWWTI
jgi:hypothetical protein